MSYFRNYYLVTKLIKEQRLFLIGMLDNHLQMDRKEFLSSVKKLLHNEDFGIVYWDDPWLVFKRDANKIEAFYDVMSKLANLRKKWL